MRDRWKLLKNILKFGDCQGKNFLGNLTPYCWFSVEITIILDNICIVINMMNDG